MCDALTCHHVQPRFLRTFSGRMAESYSPIRINSYPELPVSFRKNLRKIFISNFIRLFQLSLSGRILHVWDVDLSINSYGNLYGSSLPSSTQIRIHVYVSLQVPQSCTVELPSPYKPSHFEVSADQYFSRQIYLRLNEVQKSYLYDIVSIYYILRVVFCARLY